MSSLDQGYADFLAAKAPRIHAAGIPGIHAADMPPHLFDFQRECAAFCLRAGRAGLFLATGLGKTLVELEWATKAAEATNGRALVLTPLAVARQIEREAQRFGYDARVIREASDVRDGISVCNYDRLDRLDPDAFGAVALDESSIVRNFMGKTSNALISSFSRHRFRLSATATPAPNDHVELGQHSEFVGAMTRTEMLSRFFINDTATASRSWRIKGHARTAFWDWLASWSRAAQDPADLGFDGSRYNLPPMRIIRHATHGDTRAPAGLLFAAGLSATRLHDVKRQTAGARAGAVADAVAAEPAEPWVVWCDTDYEAAAIKARIPDAVEVRGSMPADAKEEALAAFAEGGIRVLLTKPSVAGYGLNWQHCARMAFAGRSFSFEMWHQAVRRCWRFGQAREVHVHIVVAEGEDQIGRAIDRKAAGHAEMHAEMASAMRRAMGAEAATKVRYNPTHEGRLPSWL